MDKVEVVVVSAHLDSELYSAMYEKLQSDKLYLSTQEAWLSNKYSKRFITQVYIPGNFNIDELSVKLFKPTPKIWNKVNALLFIGGHFKSAYDIGLNPLYKEAGILGEYIQGFM